MIDGPGPASPKPPPNKTEQSSQTPPAGKPPTTELSPQTPPAAKPTKPSRVPPSLGVRFLRWVLVVLLLILLGFLAALLGLYNPLLAREKQARTDLQAASLKVGDLQSQVDNLSPKAAACQNADMQILVLNARTDTLMAQLALAKNDSAKASTALSSLPDRLKILTEQLPTDQRDAAVKLQERLQLVQRGMAGQEYDTALADLEILANGLLKILTGLAP